MLLKRYYKTPEGWTPTFNDRGDCTNAPPLDYVAMAHTGIKQEQNFSERLVKNGINEGWITLSQGTLILHVTPEDLLFTIKRMPGRYENPKARDGYDIVNAYECVLKEGQHDRFRLRPAVGARPHKFHPKARD